MSDDVAAVLAEALVDYYGEENGSEAFHTANRAAVAAQLAALTAAGYAVRGHAMSELSSIAGDLWNELESLRDTWEGTERAPFIEHHIARYEKWVDLYAIEATP